MVLEPGEVVGGWPQVLSSFVAHDELDPEDRSVQGLYRLIMVNGGQPHSLLFVAKGKAKKHQFIK